MVLRTGRLCARRLIMGTPILDCEAFDASAYVEASQGMESLYQARQFSGSSRPHSSVVDQHPSARSSLPFSSSNLACSTI